ncbi:MAG: ABC transporter substrate-binding protein [Aggregatilineales bacterium]
MLRKRALLIIAILILALSIGMVPTLGQDDSELTFGLSFTVDTLDPGATSFSGVEMIVEHVFDTLVRQQPLGTFHPALATEWTVNEDATEYIFTLRQDVTFHDGTPFNAEAVQFTFDRIVDPDTNSQMAFSFIGPYAGSEVLDEYTIAVRFSTPNAAFLDGVSHPQLGPVSPTAVEALGEDWGFSGIVGTGPFIFESYTPDSEVVLVRNPDYNWGNEDLFGRSGPATLERLIYKIIPEPATRVAALESGDVDMINDVSALDIARIDEDPNYDLVLIPQAGHGWSLMFNFDQAPTNELAVRQAVALAIDKEFGIEAVENGYAVGPACSALTGAMFGWTSASCDAYPYDPVRAGEVLDEAGWIMNEETGIRERDGEPLVIGHYSADRARARATGEWIQEDLAAVGIDFQLNFSDVAAYLEVVRAGQHNTQQWWDTQTNPDAVFRTLFDSSNADGGTNRNRYRDEEMDTLIDLGASIADPVERAAVYAQIQQKIADEAIMVFLYDPYYIYAAVPGIEGVVTLSGGLVPFFYAATFSG